MYCKNCGNLIEETQSFCTNCGSKKEIEINNKENVTLENQTQNKRVQNTNNQNPINNNIQNTNNQISNNTSNNKLKEKNIVVVILIVLGVIIVGIVLISILLFSVVNKSSNKLECKSDKGDITIMYTENEIVGYTAFGITYDLDEQKKVAEQIGVKAYLEEFNTWFKMNTNGICTLEGKEFTSDNHDNEKNNTLIDDYEYDEENNVKTKVVGDKKYGYLNIPINWTDFIDVESNDALQYSYANVYIVILDYVKESNNFTAKQMAQNFLNGMKSSTEVAGVTGSTVKIGKNQEYLAYQVYMYYPSDGTYLVTYWFDTGDGVVRYLALEGPAELNGVKITDYLHIPESYSITK